MSRKRHTAADEPHFLVRTLAADFADGAVVAPHAHPWGQLIYAATGVVTVWTSHGTWVVPPHWAIWAPSSVEHGLRFTGAASLRTLYLRPWRRNARFMEALRQLGAGASVKRAAIEAGYHTPSAFVAAFRS